MQENRPDDHTRTFVPIADGTTVSHYRIISRIGAGGMGQVYLAEDTRLDRRVALKFLPLDLSQDPEGRARFTREARAAARLDHPNIAAVYEVGDYRGRPFYSMQVVDGRSLRDVIREKDLPMERVLEIAGQLCEGLRAAHEQGIVHRDIKPSNILLDSHGRVRIVDFGLASIPGSEPLTKTGSTIGTSGYMSPEQAQGTDLDHRSDLFSFGIVLYEMITRQNPFKRDTEAASLNAIINDIPQPLSRYNRDVPEFLESVMEKLLEKNPAHRYQDAAAVLSDLRRLASTPLPSPGTKDYRPSIAVLPFVNLSADPEQEYFCDGMAEEIINALTHVEGLRVVARTSCFAFKDRREDVRDIGRKLNVDHVLEGSIRKAGNRLRITGQLVKISDGFHLWSEKYDRDLKDVFEIQDEISSAIAENLNARLLGGKETGAMTRRTTGFDAYRLYLRGRWLFDQRTENSLRGSIDCYTRAIEKDPDFAPAYVGLAFSYCELPQFSSYPQKDALAEARKAAEKALEIDDRYAEAHTAFGVILAEFDWNWTKAEAEYSTAIELNPASAETRFWYSQLLLYLARMDEAIRQITLAQELDPLSLAVNKYLGLTYLCAGQYEAAEKTLKNSIKLAPGMTYLHGLLGLLYLDKGMIAEALSEFRDEEKNEADVPSMITAWKCIAMVAEGCTSEVRDILEGMLEEHRRNRGSPYAISTVYFALGDRKSGFDWLYRAADERDYMLRYVKAEPTNGSRRNDPLFKKLIAKIGLQ